MMPKPSRLMNITDRSVGSAAAETCCGRGSSAASDMQDAVIGCFGRCGNARPVACSSPRGVQRLAHLDGQILLAERLLDEVHALVEAAMVHDGVLGVAGHEQHPEHRMSLA